MLSPSPQDSVHIISRPELQEYSTHLLYLNLVNKKSVQICFLHHHRTAYSIVSILSLGLQCLKYLLTGPIQKKLATSGMS